jgi:hypothetical protein
MDIEVLNGYDELRKAISLNLGKYMLDGLLSPNDLEVPS